MSASLSLAALDLSKIEIVLDNQAIADSSSVLEAYLFQKKVEGYFSIIERNIPLLENFLKKTEYSRLEKIECSLTLMNTKRYITILESASLDKSNEGRLNTIIKHLELLANQRAKGLR